MDPAKLKVVELRTELSKRGLDTKGNKAVLVERLRQALDDETEHVEQGEREASESEGTSSSEEDTRRTRRAKEKTPEPVKVPPRTPGRSTRNAAASAMTPKTPTRSTVRTTVTSLKMKAPELGKAENSDDEEPPAKQTKLDEKKTEATDNVDKPKVSEDKPQQEAENLEKSPAKVRQRTPEIAVKTQESPVKSPVVQVSPVKMDNLTKTPAKSQECQPVVKVQMSPVKATTASPMKQQQSPAQQQETPGSVKVQLSPVKIQQSPVKMQQSPVKMQQSPVKIQGTSTVVTIQQRPVKTQLSPTPVVQEASPVKPKLQSPVSKTQLQSPAEAQESPSKTVVQQSEKVLEAQVICNLQPRQSPQKSYPGKAKSPGKSPMKTEERTNLDVPKTESQPEDVKKSSAESAEADKSPNTSPRKKVQSNSKMDVEETVELGKGEERMDSNSEVKAETEDVDMKEAKEKKEPEVKRDDNPAQSDRKRKRSPSPQEDNAPRVKPDDEPEFNEETVILSWYDSDLNLQIDSSDFTSATPMNKEGFGLVWAGARASYGFTNGRVYYEARIIEKCPVDLKDENSPHLLRLGWSATSTSMQLGEERLSYGYDGSGKKSTDCNFVDYGVEFGVDDVVVSYLDMSDGDVAKISYAVNGNDLGEAFVVEKKELDGKALFPHVLSKNCKFACNFGQEKQWSEMIREGFVPVGTVELKDRTAGPKRPIKKEDCEMIMLCGLPGSGKTFWCSKYASEHPEKMYNILGTSSLINKMKVMGLPLKDNYRGQWDALLTMCTRALNILLDKAYTRRRNYILDQHNLYPQVQKRKMRNFTGFARKAVVIVPGEEEYKKRSQQRERLEGKEVPDSAVLEMKASFSAPEVGEFIDAVEWPELEEQEAKKLIEQYNKEGKAAGYSQQTQSYKRPRMDSKDSRDSRSNRDHRRGGFSDRNRNTSWRGRNSGWRDNRQVRGGGGGGGHMRHGSFGGPGAWRPRGPPPLGSHRGGVSDRRGGGASGDRRQGNDRNRSSQSRQGGWGNQSGYQGQQSGYHPQGGWSGSQSQGWNQSGMGGYNQQWNNWQKYGQSNYSSNYQQSYDNGNYGAWNQQQYYNTNQYWGQPQQSGQSMATSGSQAVSKQ